MENEELVKIESVLQENKRLKTAINKVNDIRNSIIGLQKINWSEHIYPLVAALNEAGIEGMPYDEARGHFGTMLERTVKAEERIKELKEKQAKIIKYFIRHPYGFVDNYTGTDRRYLSIKEILERVENKL